MLSPSKIITRLYHSQINFRTTFPSFVNMKHIGIPSCSDCIHFVNSVTDNPSHSKCRKFAKLNVISKQVTLSYADINRQHSDLCGASARYKETVTQKAPNLSESSDDKFLYP